MEQPVVETEIRPLPETYKVNGYTYTMVKRTDKAALFSGRLTDDPESDVSYEVMTIRRAKAATISPKGKPPVHVPAREVLPGNEDFGSIAWSASSLEHAEVIFDEINQGIRPKPMIKGEEPDPDPEPRKTKMK